MGVSAAGSRRSLTQTKNGALKRSGKNSPCSTGPASLASHPPVAEKSLFLKPIKEKILYSQFSQTTPLSSIQTPTKSPAPKVLRESRGAFSKAASGRVRGKAPYLSFTPPTPFSSPFSLAFQTATSSPDPPAEAPASSAYRGSWARCCAGRRAGSCGRRSARSASGRDWH